MKLGWITTVLLVLTGLAVGQEQSAQQVQDLLQLAHERELSYRDQEASALVEKALKLEPGNEQAKRAQQRLAKYENLEALQAMAKEGDPAAMNRLGDRYARGRGLKASADQAIEWYRKSAEKGDVDGLYRVGLMLQESDESGAAQCYKAAAEAGSAVAARELAWVYLRGLGLEKNVEQGVGWLQKAADKGNVGAMIDLAGAYEVGAAVGKSAAKAAELRRRALESLEERIRQVPTSALAYDDLATAQVRLEKPEDAIKTLRRGVDATGGDADLRYNLVMLLVQQRQQDEAQVQAEQGLQGNPKDKRLRHWLIGTLLRSDRDDEALTQIEQALKNDGKDAYALGQRATVKMSRNDVKGAAQDYRLAIAADGTNPMWHEDLGYALQRLDQTDAAVAAYRKAMEMQPSGTARFRLAALEMDRKNYGAVDKLLDEGEKNWPESDRLWLPLHARSYLDRKDADRAAQLIEKALKLKAPNWGEVADLIYMLAELPDSAPRALKLSDEAMTSLVGSRNWGVRMIRGAILAKLKEKDKALIEFDAAMVEVDRIGSDAAAERAGVLLEMSLGAKTAVDRLSARRHPRWLVPLAWTYLETKDYSRATKTLDELLGKVSSLSPTTQARAWEMSAQVWQKIAESDPSANEKAKNAYRQCLSILEKNKTLEPQVMVLNNLAWLLATQPHPDVPEALKLSTRAVKLMEQVGIKNEALLDTHGWCLVLAGKTDQGIEFLKKALVRESSAVEAHYHLAEAYLIKKMPREAMEHIEKAKAGVKEQSRTPEAVDPDVLRKLPDVEKRARKMLDGKNEKKPTEQHDAAEEDKL